MGNSFRAGIALALSLAAEMASALPLQTIGTFCGTFPDQCRKGTESLLAVRGSGTDAYYVMEVDPTTGAIPVSGTFNNASVSTTGSAVPASATYVGGNDGGTLKGIALDTSARQVVVGAGTAGTAAGGVLTIQGSASGTAVPVSGTLSSGGKSYATSVRNAYASTNVTTGAWVQLIAAMPAAATALTLFDSSGQTLELGVGASSSESRVLIIPPGGIDGQSLLTIANGARVSVRAVSATASVGELDITLYQ